MGSLQRICAHYASIHSNGDGDPPRVAARAGGELLRPGVILELRDEASLAARITETGKEERQGSKFHQATKEACQDELSRSSYTVAVLVDLYSWSTGWSQLTTNPIVHLIDVQSPVFVLS